MKRSSRRVLLFTACLIISLFHATPAATSVHFWSQRFGDANRQEVYSVATDGSGNVIVTGHFFGTVDFGGGDLTSDEGGDIFVAKFNAAGVHQWSQCFGDAEQQAAYAVATDESGNVIVTGYFFGTVNFGGGDLTSAPGAADLFVVKFDAAGVHQWSQRFGDEGGALGTSVATDGGGNVIVTGYFGGTLNFGGEDLTSPLGPDIFVAKFNAAGVHQWSRQFGDANYQWGGSVATDGSGNVIATGYFYGTVNFGGGDLTDQGDGDAFVVKFNAAGVHQWSQQFRAAIGPDGVATDASGNVIITGWFGGTVDFGGGNLTSAGDYDIFVARFDAAGVHQWSRRFGNYTTQQGYSVAMDASGGVVVTGRFWGTVDFGGGNLTSAGDADVFVAAFNAAGAHQWSERFGGASYQYGESVATDGNGNAIVTGFFYGSVDFGGGNLTSAGDEDLFVAKFGGLPVGVSDTPKSVFSLSSFPNPFNPATTVRYTLPSKGRVTVSIVDLRGARVAMLLDEEKDGGAYTSRWDGNGASGQRVGPGVYFARVTHPSGTKSYKVVLLK